VLHLIPAPAHRLSLRLAHALRKRWWRLARPRLAGCRVLALDAEARVLLVRHSYGPDHWTPPGGGLGRGEDPLEAARRELLEETACRLEMATSIAVIEENLHGAGNSVHVIAGLTRDLPRPDGREIVDAQFFAIDGLPQAISARMRMRLPDWITAAKAAHRLTE